MSPGTDIASGGRRPQAPGAATGIVKPWPEAGNGKPHRGAACFNAGDWTIEAVSEKEPSGPPRNTASGAGSVDGGEVVGSGNDLRPCARRQSAYVIPADAVAEPEPPPGFPEDPQAARTRAQLRTARATDRSARGMGACILNGLCRITHNSDVTRIGNIGALRAGLHRSHDGATTGGMSRADSRS
jgi:hypothetical protein